MIAYTMVRVLSNRLNDAHISSMAELQAKNRQLVKAYEELKAAQEQIIEKEKLERELQVAYEIQMSILPQSLPVMKGFDFGARIVPARAVGGDFYDFFPLEGHKMGILVGDVTDKGVPAAIFMAQTHALLRAEASHHTSPREVLLSANHHILNRNEKGLFVTVLYGILDWSTRCFTYARAGHELPILSVPGEQPVFAPKNPGQPLGILDEPLLDEQTLTIPPGGRLLLYTDGITDERNPQGESFGFERLIQAVSSAGGLSAQDSCDLILNIVIDFLNCTPQFDDVTMVVIHSH
jgi:serine phosphatase RsbU (regulator of sigma subunit)